MKERPILFNGEMVRAILDGRKTMTRRPVKPQPGPLGIHPAMRVQMAENPPLGTIGDRLWVRETWRVDGIARGMALRFGDCKTTREGMSYRADMEGDRSCDDCDWMPSAWMPRWASRIDLEITAVRVERVQDITEEDAKKEGVSWNSHIISEESGNPEPYEDASDAFRTLWQSIYGTWDVNPWVWVYEFRRIKP